MGAEMSDLMILFLCVLIIGCLLWFCFYINYLFKLITIIFVYNRKRFKIKNLSFINIKNWLYIYIFYDENKIKSKI